MVRFRLLCGDFLLPDPAPHLDNRMTVCMGYPAMTPQGRAGKRRRKGAGKPCRENGAPNINWSKWPVDVMNDTKRHSPKEHSALSTLAFIPYFGASHSGKYQNTVTPNCSRPNPQNGNLGDYLKSGYAFRNLICSPCRIRFPR